jgi:hypothetical protein
MSELVGSVDLIRLAFLSKKSDGLLCKTLLAGDSYGDI